jgi:hypothetical protein
MINIINKNDNNNDNNDYINENNNIIELTY